MSPPRSPGRSRTHRPPSRARGADRPPGPGLGPPRRRRFLRAPVSRSSLACCDRDIAPPRPPHPIRGMTTAAAVPIIGSMAPSPTDMLDVVVIGAGPAGVIASLRAARLGARTALITRDEFGGMAANDGPVPVRTLAQAARLIREARQLPRYGITSGELSLDYSRLLARVHEVTEDVRNHSLLRDDLDAAGVAIHERAGTARFVDPHTVESDNAPRLRADKVIICTGGTSRRLAVPGFDLTATHSDAWHLSAVPESLLVLGAGATGVQVASIFNALRLTRPARRGCSADLDERRRRRLGSGRAPPWQRQAFGSSRTPDRSSASSVLRAGYDSFIQRTVPRTASTPRSRWSRLDGWRRRPG